MCLSVKRRLKSDNPPDFSMDSSTDVCKMLSQAPYFMLSFLFLEAVV